MDSKELLCAQQVLTIINHWYDQSSVTIVGNVKNFSKSFDIKFEFKDNKNFLFCNFSRLFALPYWTEKF